MKEINGILLNAYYYINNIINLKNIFNVYHYLITVEA